MLSILKFLNPKSWLIAIGVVAVIAGLSYVGYQYSQARINEKQLEIEQIQRAMVQIRANNVTLKTAVETNEQTIDFLQKDYQKIRENYDQISNEMQVIRLQNQELQARLAEHDLSALALAKPLTVQRIINNASDKVNRCFEIMTGSPLTEAERNATNETQFNSECPWLFSTTR